MVIRCHSLKLCDDSFFLILSFQARPFGVSLLLAGVDENGPALWHTDPSGTHTRYLAKAIGAGSEGAQNSLKEQYNKSLTLKEAQKMACQILKEVMEDKISSTNIEVGIVEAKEAKWKVLGKEDIESIISTLEEGPI